MDTDAAQLTKQFRQIYRNLKLFPLFKKEEIEAFRVLYGQAMLGKLRREVSQSPEEMFRDFKLGGHRLEGCWAGIGASWLLFCSLRLPTSATDRLGCGFSYGVAKPGA